MTARGRFAVSLMALVVPAAACSGPPTSPTPTVPVLSTVSVASLPGDGSIDSLMTPSDPGAYLGEPQESPYLDHVKRFVFSVSNKADLIVELGWSRMSGVELRMAIQDDAVMSTASGVLQVIVLPKGTRGTLIVGQESGPASQTVPFTISTYRFGG